MMYPFYYKRPFKQYYLPDFSSSTSSSIATNSKVAANLKHLTNQMASVNNNGFSNRKCFASQKDLTSIKNFANQKNFINIKNSVSQSEDDESININKKSSDYFEILGFKLHYDDLIIIGLILLLFSEGVNDQFLIIALVLLIGD